MHIVNYVSSPALLDAVNVAIALGQPLLLTGKTQLAWYVADCFSLGEPLVFNAQTTTLNSRQNYAKSIAR